jgi:hypothetical protein
MHSRILQRHRAKPWNHHLEIDSDRAFLAEHLLAFAGVASQHRRSAAHLLPVAENSPRCCSPSGYSSGR